MLDTRTCNARRSMGCSATSPTVAVGTNPAAVAVDPATHTVYVANAGKPDSAGTVTVLDDRRCNSTDQSGCAASTLNVPDGNPDGIAVNPLTDTVYVATLTSDGGPDLISVFNGGTCNAATTTGCGQTPASVATGSDGGPDGSTEYVAVNPSTNTIYATNVTHGNPFLGDTVYVIDGPTCDAADTTGCGNPPATISVGSDPFFGDANPFGIAVDQATDTIYTANIVNGEGRGFVSVIDGATCNSQNMSGCDQTPATAPAGFGTAGDRRRPNHQPHLRHQHRRHQRHHDQRQQLQRHQPDRLQPHSDPTDRRRLPSRDHSRPPSRHRIRRRRRRSLGPTTTSPLTNAQIRATAGAASAPTPRP